VTGFLAAFTEAPIDFYKSQIQVQVIRSKSDPNYKRESPLALPLLSLPDQEQQLAHNLFGVPLLGCALSRMIAICGVWM
jgi:hypothetical protein